MKRLLLKLLGPRVDRWRDEIEAEDARKRWETIDERIAAAPPNSIERHMLSEARRFKEHGGVMISRTHPWSEMLKREKWPEKLGE